MNLRQDKLMLIVFVIISLVVVFLYAKSCKNNKNNNNNYNNKIEIFLVDNNKLRKGVFIYPQNKNNKIDFYIYTDTGKLGGELTKDKADNILSKGEKDGTVLKFSHEDNYIRDKTGFSLQQIAKIRSSMYSD